MQTTDAGPAADRDASISNKDHTNPGPRAGAVLPPKAATVAAAVAPIATESTTPPATATAAPATPASPIATSSARYLSTYIATIAAGAATRAVAPAASHLRSLLQQNPHLALQALKSLVETACQAAAASVRNVGTGTWTAATAASQFPFCVPVVDNFRECTPQLPHFYAGDCRPALCPPACPPLQLCAPLAAPHATGAWYHFDYTFEQASPLAFEQLYGFSQQRFAKLWQLVRATPSFASLFLSGGTGGVQHRLCAPPPRTWLAAVLFQLSTGERNDKVSLLFGIEAGAFAHAKRLLVHAIVEALHGHGDACLGWPQRRSGWGALASTFHPHLFTEASISLGQTVAAAGKICTPLQLEGVTEAEQRSWGGGVGSALQSSMLLFDGHGRILDAALLARGDANEDTLLDDLPCLASFSSRQRLLTSTGRRRGDGWGIWFL